MKWNEISTLIHALDQKFKYFKLVLNECAIQVRVVDWNICGDEFHQGLKPSRTEKPIIIAFFNQDGGHSREIRTAVNVVSLGSHIGKFMKMQ